MLLHSQLCTEFESVWIGTSVHKGGGRLLAQQINTVKTRGVGRVLGIFLFFGVKVEE